MRVGLRYNEAFEQASLSGELCYEALHEFLNLLLSDGVQKVWFDALCIYQQNNEEKELDICSILGAYYRIGTETGFRALDAARRLPKSSHSLVVQSCMCLLFHAGGTSPREQEASESFAFLVEGRLEPLQWVLPVKTLFKSSVLRQPISASSQPFTR
ncbi:hypothetical protein GOP47_0028640 [Adiantum capillus-veneris]|nr:hypothetical protein GOP47_0028640 [Adiantum capillus-veneris]